MPSDNYLIQRETMSSSNSSPESGWSTQSIASTSSSSTAASSSGTYVSDTFDQSARPQSILPYDPSVAGESSATTIPTTGLPMQRQGALERPIGLSEFGGHAGQPYQTTRTIACDFFHISKCLRRFGQGEHQEMLHHTLNDHLDGHVPAVSSCSFCGIGFPKEPTMATASSGHKWGPNDHKWQVYEGFFLDRIIHMIDCAEWHGGEQLIDWALVRHAAAVGIMSMNRYRQLATGKLGAFCHDDNVYESGFGSDDPRTTNDWWGNGVCDDNAKNDRQRKKAQMQSTRPEKSNRQDSGSRRRERQPDTRRHN